MQLTAGKNENDDKEARQESRVVAGSVEDPEPVDKWLTIGEDTSDPSLPQKHSALLLLLHALASKPSFVHLQIIAALNPFVFDHMPVWPHLLSIDVSRRSHLRRYCFELR